MICAARTKWWATAASIWIQCTSGSIYCFGVYSSLLQSSQGYSRTALNTVALFKDIGGNAGISSGLLYTSSILGGGPFPVLLFGSIFGFSGFFSVWLSVAGYLPRFPLPLMCFLMFLASNSTTFLNTACVVTAAQNFPDIRGTAVGIMKGFLGLSGAILVQLYRTSFEGKPSYFLLMLAILPTFITLILTSFVHVFQEKQREEKRILNGFSIVSIVVAMYLMMIIIWQNIQPLAPVTHIFISTLLLLLLASPVYVAIKGTSWNSQENEDSITERSPLLEREERGGNEGSNEGEKITRGIPSGQPIRNEGMYWRNHDLGLLQAIRTLNFWLLFMAMACGMGSGLATVNNIGQIGHKLGYTSKEINTLVSLWSIWNFFGRFGAGYTSDYFLRSKGFPRPLFISITLGIMSIGHVIISSGMPGALYYGSIFIGLCYGCQWSLAPIITSEIFGLTHMGTVFNMISLASPFGSFILSMKVVGYLFDVQVGRLSDLRACTNNHCFMVSFLVMGSVSFCGSIISLVLYFRTRAFYRNVIFPRLQAL